MVSSVSLGGKWSRGLAAAVVVTTGVAIASTAVGAELSVGAGMGPGSWKTGKITNDDGLAACAAVRPIEDGAGVAALIEAGGETALIVGSLALPQDNPKIDKTVLRVGDVEISRADHFALSPGYYGFRSPTDRLAETKGLGAGPLAVELTAGTAAYGVGFDAADLADVLDRLGACALDSESPAPGRLPEAKLMAAWVDKAIGSYSGATEMRPDDDEDDESQLVFEEEDKGTSSGGGGKPVLSHTHTIRPDVAAPFFVAAVEPDSETSGGTGATAGSDDTKTDAGKEEDGTSGATAGTDDGEEPLTGTALYVALQKELARVGCYTSSIDGKWGNGSKSALRRFLAADGGGSDELSAELVNRISAVEGRVCKRLVCGRGKVARAGKCVDARPARTADRRRRGVRRDDGYDDIRRDRRRDRRPRRRRGGSSCWEHLHGTHCRTFD